jgi:hypothetical protein
LEKDSTSSEGRKTRSGKPLKKVENKMKKMKKKRQEEKRVGGYEEGIQWGSCFAVAQKTNGVNVRKGSNRSVDLMSHKNKMVRL